MLLKFFLIYIGTFFIFAIAFVMVAKNFAPGLGSAGKKPVLLGGFSAIVAALGAYVATMFADHLFTIFWLFTGIFIIFGIIHLLFFHKKYFNADKDKGKAILAEILFMFAFIFFIVVVFSSLQYFLKKDKEFLFFPMLMSMIAFFIPLLVHYTFEAAYNIPVSEFPLWQYPLDEPIDLPEERANEKLLVIAFVLSKKTTDKAKTNFRAKGPDTMKLGDLYYHFINDYNEEQNETPIQYADNETSAHEWGFRVKPKWYQRHRILDPELTIRENKIRENSIIICERI